MMVWSSSGAKCGGRSPVRAPLGSLGWRLFQDYSGHGMSGYWWQWEAAGLKMGSGLCH